VFPSDFEGFGLPVVEGMLLGKPVVVGPDEAVLEVAGGHAAVMSGWTSSALADAVRAGLAMSPDQLAAARAHAAEFTWERTTRQSRAAVVAAARSARDAQVRR
jgi:glycosyltransferase involved in cell wall biosynthesis